MKTHNPKTITTASQPVLRGYHPQSQRRRLAETEGRRPIQRRSCSPRHPRGSCEQRSAATPSPGPRPAPGWVGQKLRGFLDRVPQKLLRWSREAAVAGLPARPLSWRLPAPGCPARGARHIPPLACIFRSSKNKNTKIRGERGSPSWLGRQKQQSLGGEGGEREKQLGNHYLLVKPCLG